MSVASLTVPAPAKLNLFLHVTGRREDGYHLLQTLFVFLDIADILTVERREDGVIRRSAHDYPVEVPEEADLVVRAARRLQAESGTTLGANIRIEKRLPLGGGLGGGSSDAASTLLALNRLWALNWPRTRLAALGLCLGADVPVFIHGRSAWAEGVGEVLQAADVASFYALVLVPPVGVSTPLIFGDPELTRNSLALKMPGFPAGTSAVQQKVFLTQQRNDLQPVACRLAAAVALHLAALEKVSANAWFARDGMGGARMTGSGACVFALFDTESEAKAAQAKLPGKMKSFVARGVSRHPLNQDD